MAAEKMAKNLEAQLNELNARLDDSSRNLNDMTSQKSRAASDAANLGRQLEEAESQIAQLTSKWVKRVKLSYKNVLTSLK